MPTFGSLFAGIGGIDLGLERAGWTGRWQVEYDPFCTRVLEKHWPDVTRYGDITEVDWSGVEPVDLIAGGFPCQPVSVAGKRRAQDDERWLWPEFVRAIRDLGPRVVLVENVPGLLVRGMGDIQRDLAALGYWRRWDVLAAADVGAPHLRERVWIVASRTELPRPLADPDDGGSLDALQAGWNASRDGGSDGVADTRSGDGGSGRPRRPEHGGEGLSLDTHLGTTIPMADTDDAGRGEQRRAVSVRPQLVAAERGRTAARDWWATEPDVGRVAHGVPSRVDRLRSLGNAVVPQVVEVIGRQLLASMEAAA